MIISPKYKRPLAGSMPLSHRWHIKSSTPGNMQSSAYALKGIPDGIWTHNILSLLEQKDQINAALVCKKMFSVVRSHVQLLEIPNRIWIHDILPYLDQHDLTNLSLVSKKMLSISRNPKLWIKLVIYERPTHYYSPGRSIHYFRSLAKQFDNLSSVTICLKDKWQGEPQTAFEEIILALKELVKLGQELRYDKLRSMEFHINHHGLLFPRSDCLSLFKTLEDLSYKSPTLIQDVKLKETCTHQSYIRWWHWTEEFVQQAPNFWSRVQKLDIDDTNLNYSRTYKIDEKAFCTILEGCPRLTELNISSWSSCNCKQLHFILRELEDSIIELFNYKTGWIMNEPNNFQSHIYHVNWNHCVSDDMLLFCATKK